MRGHSADILVTGGTGLLGRSLVRRLVAAGLSVRVISRTERPSSELNISICRGDLTAAKDLRAALLGCRAVFHCAAEKTDARQMTAVNVVATQILFDLARELRIELFCHLSSVGVIGKTSSTIADETTPCNPMNRYEETKLAAEEIVRQGVDGGRVLILRPTNIFSGETLQTLLCNSVRARTRQFLKGHESSHFVYVEDVAAAATYWLQASPERSVDTYIVSSDEETGIANRDVQEIVASEVQTAPRPPRFSAPLSVPYLARLLRHGAANRGDVIYSSRKLVASGFHFPYGLKRGLKDALNRSRCALGAPRVD